MSEDFIVDIALESFEICKVGQKLLFLRTYEEIKADVKRICAKVDVVTKYGATDWSKFDPAITDILVNLRFRGDNTPNARVLIQTAAAHNDLTAGVVRCAIGPLPGLCAAGLHARLPTW